MKNTALNSLKTHYDYIIVGCGLFGATCARELTDAGKKVLILERRNHFAGNAYTEYKEGICVHKYGAHIFHTDNDRVWDYVNRFTKFNNFQNNVLANYKGNLYHLPFNMNTFKEIWPDIKDEEDAKRHIEEEVKLFGVKEPKNLEEQAINLVGKTIYEILIKGYTSKQWNADCKDLSPLIIKRIPVRFNYNNNYFNDKYQGIPVDGYTKMVENMIKGIQIKLNTDFITDKEKYFSMADHVIYTGALDELFDYCFGELSYRSLKFVEKTLDKEKFQEKAVINYVSSDVPYTRVIEHKHFNNDKSDKTIIYEEYPQDYKKGKERFYSVNNEKTANLYEKYLKLAKENDKLILGGRLGLYSYLDMDDTILEALKLVDILLKK